MRAGGEVVRVGELRMERQLERSCSLSRKWGWWHNINIGAGGIILTLELFDKRGTAANGWGRMGGCIDGPDFFADNGNVRLLHELEKLNSLLEMFCDLGVIGRNNSLGAHTMSAQTLSCVCGG